MRSFPGPGCFGRAGWWVPPLLALASCMSQGEKLARTYCAACHAFPDPGLLDKKTWQNGVLPVMAIRVGASPSSFSAMLGNPYLTILDQAMSPEESWRASRRCTAPWISRCTTWTATVTSTSCT